MASVAFWVLQFRVFRPRLELAPTIARARMGHPQLRYRIKFHNKSRRDLYDFAVVIHCYMPDLVREGHEEIMRVADWTRPILDGRKWLAHTIHLEEMPDRTRAAYGPYFPKKIQKQIENGEYLDVCEFLRIRPNTRLVIYVSVTDSLSGARQMVTHEYSINEIREGAFHERSFEHEESGDHPPPPSDRHETPRNQPRRWSGGPLRE